MVGVARRPHHEAFRFAAFYFNHLFVCVDAEISIQCEMKIVGKQFFASRLFANWFQRAFFHLQLVSG